MNTLSPTEIAIGLLALTAIVAVIVMVSRNRRDGQMGGDHGEEHVGTIVQDSGTNRSQSLLREREKRLAVLYILRLTPAQRHGFIEDWLAIQARFADDPSGAVLRADLLLSDVMLARGYPVAEFEQRYEDLSADHAEVVAHYRTAHAIAGSQSRGEARPEELRRAMIHYRTLFDDLVNEPEEFGPIIEHHDGRIHDLRKEPTRRD